MAHHFQSCETPGDYFLQFFDSEIRGDIVFQTNLYANQKGKHFYPFTERKLFGFAGINFVMGYYKLPSWIHYWKNYSDLSIPIVSDTMPRNRFDKSSYQ